MQLLPFVLAAACLMLCAQQHAPMRTVQGNVLTSTADPAVRLTLPSDVQFVGKDHWPLYGVADCELFVFAQVNRDKVVTGLYWVQFEQYLSSSPESHYTYPGKFDTVVPFGGTEMYLRARFGRSDDPDKPGSDGEHMRALLRRKGLQLPLELRNVRLVTTDPGARKELMIIYAEDLAPTGMHMQDLLPTGKDAAKLPDVERGVTDHARERVHMELLKAAGGW